jgi:hypothetical protein
MMTLRTFAASAALSLALVAAPALAKTEAPKPSGTIMIDETNIGLLFGGSMGGGKLVFKGKTYPFKIGGLSFGANVGVTKSKATGTVYGLTDVSKFPGTYAKAAASMTFVGGGGGIQLENEHGVKMVLQTSTKGLQLDAGGGGVKITMK